MGNETVTVSLSKGYSGYMKGQKKQARHPFIKRCNYEGNRAVELGAGFAYSYSGGGTSKKLAATSMAHICSDYVF